jgi:hypothetical protein
MSSDPREEMRQFEALKRRLTAVREQRRAELDNAVLWVNTTLRRVLRA